MTVYYNLQPDEIDFNNPVVTIGSFDGVHLGHRKIFSRVSEIARQKNGEAIVITFTTHPRKILTPQTPPRILTTAREKIRAIENCGMDHIVMLPFTRELAKLSAHDFLHNIVFYNFGKSHIVIGYDHAFGHNREGNFEFLTQASQREGFDVTRVDPMDMGSKPVSSSWIRTEIEDGNVEEANRLLGREYSVSGMVVEGVGRGRTIGFPTANIVPDDEDKVIPRDGVYAVKVDMEGGQTHDGMLNIGTNPTFSNLERSIEVHILDFTQDIYKQVIFIRFVKRIRDEIKFSSVDDLMTQLKKDRETSLKILRF
ncbi:MAG: bifunctional riboflavin kinase/FAD synthetase [Spirochaetota bacterium]